MAVGTESGGESSSFAVYRFHTSDLTGDASFSPVETSSFSAFSATSVAGLITTSIDSTSEASALTVQPDGDARRRPPRPVAIGTLSP